MEVNADRFDGNRIVYVKRVLRQPEGKVTFESLPYWLAQAVVAEAFHENNTMSLWIIEMENL